MFSITGQCPAAGSVIANNIFAGKANGNLVTYYFGGDLNCQGLANFAANDWYAITGNAVQWNRVNNNTTAYRSLAEWQAGIGGGDIGATTANPLFAGNGGAGGNLLLCLISHLGRGTQPTGCPAAYKLQSWFTAHRALASTFPAETSLQPGRWLAPDFWGNPHRITLALASTLALMVVCASVSVQERRHTRQPMNGVVQ